MIPLPSWAKTAALAFTLPLLILINSLAQSVAGNSAPNEAVWLRVKDQQIVTSPLAPGGEKPFIPVGIGYCRDVLISAQDDAVMKYCKERYLNTVRLSFYLLTFNGHADRPINVDAHIRDFIDPVVDAAKRANMYVILDDHEYLSSAVDEATARQKQEAKSWDEATVQQWIDGWVKVAERYQNDPNVLGYELINEPHDIAPEDAREKITRCLQAIRKVDQRHIILVGNNDWSHARSMEATWGPTASTVDAPFNNVVFTFHDYPDDNHPWEVQRHITTFRGKHKVPVLCTEFGSTPWNKTETVCREFQCGMLTLFAKENVGWMIWALNRLKDDPRAVWVDPSKPPVGQHDVGDSCAYSDLWKPVARIMASPFPTE
ncbi:MAG: glycoside hydrolase family 5 protein [Chthoniobacteraceae bacterium]